MIDIAIQAAELAQEMQLAVERRLKIIQLDEFVVTKKTIPTHAWTGPKDNIQLNQARAYMEAFAVVLAVSRERGVELVDVYKRSINKVKFKEFLEKLRRINEFEDIQLVMDNLSVHKSNEIKDRMNELGFNYAFTPAYSPQYNGIENVIGIGKTRVKKRRLEILQQNEEEDLPRIIREEFYGISTQHVARCIARSLQLLSING